MNARWGDAPGGSVPARGRGLIAYEPALDGVRALAVLAVLFFHDGRLAGGFLGVSTFFTLSGFLITRLLLAERAATGRVSLGRFFARRARRLLPAAFAGILLAAAITVVIGNAGSPAQFRADGLSALFDVANWRFYLSGQSYAALFSAPSTLLHYWSLAVEEQFYVVLAPVLVGLLALTRGRRRLLLATLAALAAASFADGAVLVRHGVDRAYYGTDVRALEFLVGAAAAALLTGRVMSRIVSRVVAVAGAGALLTAMWACTYARTTQPGLFRGGLLAYAVASALVVVSGGVAGPVRTLCSTPPLRALGRVSYGVYVFHWPIFLWLTADRVGVSGWSLTAVRFAATFAVATVSFHVLERPVREERRVVGRTRWVTAPLGAVAVATASVLVGSAVGAAAPAVTFAPAFRPPAVVASVTTSTSSAPTSPSASTTTGTVAPRLSRVFVVGDSVALTLGRGIERWGARNGVAVWNGGALGCSLLDGARIRGYNGPYDRPDDPCRTRVTWPRTLATFRPDVVVVLYGAWDVYDTSWDRGRTWYAPGDPTFDAHYRALITDRATRLQATGARVVWLEPPCFVPGPHMANPQPDAVWWDPRRTAALAADDLAVAATAHLTVSDVARRTGCPVDLHLRPDGVHYSDPGADIVANLLGPVLREAAAGHS